MPNKPATRLYVDAALAAGASVALAAEQAHRLRTVLRLAPGDTVALFNARDGEWLGRIAALGRGAGEIAVTERRRPQASEGDLWLAFAPVKRARLDLMVEKATELGAAALLPVITRHTVAERVNNGRLRAIAVEAAEQSGRLTLPELREPQALAQLLARWPAGRHLVLCAEPRAGAADAPPINKALAALAPGPAAVLIGPEGGFAETELDGLRKLPFVAPVSLGPRILRSETAALAALAVVQAVLAEKGAARDAATGVPDKGSS